MSTDDFRHSPAKRHGLVTLLLGSLGSSAGWAAADAATIRDLKQLNVEDLMRIEVTSVARRPERLLDAASAIQVITAADIRRSGATTLPEALQQASNLQVARRNAHGWAISARGFNTELANKLLVMIDGRTVYTPLFSGVYWEVQDYLLEDIDRIEIISGPGGTLWGANAVNGVINIITRPAADTAGLLAEAGTGSAMDAFAGVRYGGSLTPDTQFRTYAKYMDHDASVRADGLSSNDAWHKIQGGFRLDATSGRGALQTLQGDAYDLREGQLAGDRSAMQGANLLGRWTHRTADESEWSLQAYYDWTRMSDERPALVLNGTQHAPAGTLRDELRTADVDFQHRLAWGRRHRVVWGAGFRHTHDDVVNAPSIAFLPATLDQSLYSAFFQDQISLTNMLSVTLGSKLEHNDYTGMEVEPSVRAQWQPGGERTLWAAISRAVRTPSRVDRDLRQAEPPYLALLYGNPDFGSESVVAYELGYRAQETASLGTSVSAFYNVYRNLRSTSITPGTVLPFYFSNNLAGHAYGFELASHWQVTRNWSLRAGWNFLEERLHVVPGEYDLSNARNETADPQHQLTLRSAINLPGGLEVDAGLRWVDRLHNNNGPDPGAVPSYLDLNLRLAWRLTDRFEFSVAGQNLLRARHPEYGFPTPARAEAERSFHVRVTWQR